MLSACGFAICFEDSELKTPRGPQPEDMLHEQIAAADVKRGCDVAGEQCSHGRQAVVELESVAVL